MTRPSFCYICSSANTAKMISWCKWSTRERGSLLSCSRHNGSWAWLRWMSHMYRQSHTMAYMCTRMHACRDILATFTPSTSANPRPACVHTHTLMHTWHHPGCWSDYHKKLQEHIESPPMETSCTHKGSPFSRQVCIQLCSCAWAEMLQQVKILLLYESCMA